MAELPETILGQLEYFEQHIPVWAADPAAIGLTAAQIADITSFTGAMRIAYNNAQAARADSKSKTLLQREALGSMIGLGTALIATIKAFADVSGNSPAGTPKATYYLITHRDALNSGQSEHVTVNLGVGGGIGGSGGLGDTGEASGSMGLAA